MRLIDADALKSDIAKLKESPWFNAKEGFADRKEAIEIVEMLCVDKAPTIDPVKHGHWIEQTVSSGRDSWVCSECGRRARGKLKNLPYCHCGAKMDEGGEKNETAD